MMLLLPSLLATLKEFTFQWCFCASKLHFGKPMWFSVGGPSCPSHPVLSCPASLVDNRASKVLSLKLKICLRVTWPKSLVCWAETPLPTAPTSRQSSSWLVPSPANPRVPLTPTACVSELFCVSLCLPRTPPVPFLLCHQHTVPH